MCLNLLISFQIDQFKSMLQESEEENESLRIELQVNSVFFFHNELVLTYYRNTILLKIHE